MLASMIRSFLVAFDSNIVWHMFTLMCCSWANSSKLLQSSPKNPHIHCFKSNKYISILNRYLSEGFCLGMDLKLFLHLVTVISKFFISLFLHIFAYVCHSGHVMKLINIWFIRFLFFPVMSFVSLGPIFSETPRRSIECPCLSNRVFQHV